MLTIVNPTAGSADRVLDGPTNLVWIDPWLAYLRSRGVQYLFDAKVEEILCNDGRISGVSVSQAGKRTVVRGDHYVAALPVDRIAALLKGPLVAADPSLGKVRALAQNVEWMNGVQFYLRRPAPLAHGHVIHVDTEWAITSISQLQFWRDVPPEFLGDSDVKDIISADVSDWTAPGSNGRPAMQCTREEAVRETWNQIKRSVNVDSEVLHDDDLDSWYLDPDVVADPARPGFLMNTEPLLVNLVDSWALRPEATTAIPNLFLASDYVRTYTDVATMEAANEAARRAVNGLLDAVNFNGARCEIWPLHEPEILAPWRLYDAGRYAAGLPWDGALMQVGAQAIRAASPILELARPLLEGVAPFVAPIADALSAVGGETEAANDSAVATAGGGDAAGPTGFLERLGWYREALSDTLAAGVPTLGAAAASLCAGERFPRSGRQGASARAVHRDREGAGRARGGRLRRRRRD